MNAHLHYAIRSILESWYQLAKLQLFRLTDGFIGAYSAGLISSNKNKTLEDFAKREPPINRPLDIAMPQLHISTSSSSLLPVKRAFLALEVHSLNSLKISPLPHPILKVEEMLRAG